MTPLLKYFFCFLSLTISISVFAEKKSYTFNVSSGYFFSEGQYANEKNTVLTSIPIAVKISRGLNSIKLATNFSRFTRNENGVDKNIDGMGNAYLSIQHFIKLSRFMRYLSFKSKVKFPSTKSDAVLMSRGYDVQFSSSAYFRFSKNWLVSTFAYKWREKNFNNTFSSSINYSHTLSSKYSAGISINFEQPIQKNGEEILENMLHVNWKYSSHLKYTLYYIKGYKDPRIGWASGLQISYSW